MKVKLALLLVTLLGLTFCAPEPTVAPTPPKCSEEQYFDDLSPLYDRWSAIVEESARIGLDAPASEIIAPMAEMANIIGELEQFEPPECAKDSHEKVVEHITSGHRAFLAAWGGDSNKAATLLDKSMTALDEWIALVEEIK